MWRRHRSRDKRTFCRIEFFSHGESFVARASAVVLSLFALCLIVSRDVSFSWFLECLEM